MTAYIRVIKRWWWLLVLLTALGAAVGYVLSQTQMYEAVTTLIVAAGPPSSNVADRLIPDQRNSLVKTYRELLLKRPVLEAVIATLALQTSPEDLVKRLRISEVRDTQILVLSAQDPDPQQAAKIANATVVAFNAQVGSLLANPYAAGRGGLNVVEAASPPREPNGPGPLRNIPIAAIVGLLLAGGIVFALEYFDTRVRVEDDVVQLTGLPTIVEIDALAGRHPHERLVTLTSPSSRSAEVYRMLRLALERGTEQRPIRTLIVTSAGVGEGKSLTAANLAIALAQTGLRTILIDANLRRPTLHELFQKPNTRGITTVPGAGGAAEQTVESGIENLRLLLSGPQRQVGQVIPARLLSPDHILPMVDEFALSTDVLIFDSPPVLEAIETTLLACTCDAGLLVVEVGQTQAGDLLRACETLRRTQVELLGAVLNNTERPVVRLLKPSAEQERLPTTLDDGSRPALPFRRND